MPTIGEVFVFYWVDIDIVNVLPRKEEKYFLFCLVYTDIVLYIYIYITYYNIILLNHIIYYHYVIKHIIH